MGFAGGGEAAEVEEGAVGVGGGMESVVGCGVAQGDSREGTLVEEKVPGEISGG